MKITLLIITLFFPIQIYASWLISGGTANGVANTPLAAAKLYCSNFMVDCLGQEPVLQYMQEDQKLARYYIRKTNLSQFLYTTTFTTHCPVGQDCYVPPAGDQICDDGFYQGQYNNTCDRPANLQECEATGEVISQYGICGYAPDIPENFSPEPELFDPANQLTCTDHDTCLEKLNEESGCTPTDSYFFKFVDNTNFTYECFPSSEPTADDPITCNPDLAECSKSTEPNQTLQDEIDGTGGDGGGTGGDGGGTGGDGGGTGGDGGGTTGEINIDLTNIENSLNELLQNSNQQSQLPSNTTTEFNTASDVLVNFNTRINNAPLVTSFSNIANVIQTGGNCPTFSIDLSMTPIGQVSTNIHCELVEIIRPILTPVMIIYFSIIGFRILASS